MEDFVNVVGFVVIICIYLRVALRNESTHVPQ